MTTKIRGKLLAQGGFLSGGGFVFGLQSFTSPSLSANNGDQASMSACGVTTDHNVLLVPGAGMPMGVGVFAACGLADGIRVAMYNTTSASVASAAVFCQYLAFS